jgi:uncharacterized protein (DUF952 family)
MAVYHLVPREELDARDPAADYVPAAFAREGFIHLTDGADELAVVGNRYYRDDPRPYVALRIDLARVRAPIRYADPRRAYPHVHGPLNRDAIVAVVDVPRTPDGTFLPPEESG